MDDLDLDSDADDHMLSENAVPLQGGKFPGPISSDLESPNELPNAFSVGHRVKAARSVLALVIDEECVFAGLQGGHIVVSSM